MTQPSDKAMHYIVKEAIDEDGCPLGENLFAVITEDMGGDDVLWFDKTTADRVCAELNRAHAHTQAAVCEATEPLVDALEKLRSIATESVEYSDWPELQDAVAQADTTLATHRTKIEGK